MVQIVINREVHRITRKYDLSHPQTMVIIWNWSQTLKQRRMIMNRPMNTWRRIWMENTMILRIQKMIMMRRTTGKMDMMVLSKKNTRSSSYFIYLSITLSEHNQHGWQHQGNQRLSKVLVCWGSFNRRESLFCISSFQNFVHSLFRAWVTITSLHSCIVI